MLAGFLLSTFRTRSEDGTEFEYVIQNCNELLVPHRSGRARVRPGTGPLDAYVCMYVCVCGDRLEEIALRRRLQDAVLAAQNRGDRAEVALTDQPTGADRYADKKAKVAVSVYGEIALCAAAGDLT